MGYGILLLLSSELLGSLVHHLSHVNCTGPYCSIILKSITVSLAVIGFLLHCTLARWYKRRVRDDIYTPHRLVEEVYDRYLQPNLKSSIHNIFLIPICCILVCIVCVFQTSFKQSTGVCYCIC